MCQQYQNGPSSTVLAHFTVVFFGLISLLLWSNTLGPHRLIVPLPTGCIIKGGTVSASIVYVQLTQVFDSGDASQEANVHIYVVYLYLPHLPTMLFSWLKVTPAQMFWELPIFPHHVSRTSRCLPITYTGSCTLEFEKFWGIVKILKNTKVRKYRNTYVIISHRLYLASLFNWSQTSRIGNHTYSVDALSAGSYDHLCVGRAP